MLKIISDTMMTTKNNADFSCDHIYDGYNLIKLANLTNLYNIAEITMQNSTITTPKTLTAYEVKTRFGEALINAQSSPITVTKNGKPVLVMMSMQEFTMLENIKKEYVNLQLSQGIADAKANKMVDGETFFEQLFKN